MNEMVVSNGVSTHTGSTVVGAVAGTISVGANTFFTIEGNLVMVSNGTMNIPSHKYQNVPALFHSHSFSPNVLQNNYFLIEGVPIVLIGDNYAPDATNISNQGSNNFVRIN